MIQLYEHNGYPFFTEKEIKLRRHLETFFADGMKAILEGENSAWRMFQIEAPALMPLNLLNKNYTAEDVWMQEGGMVLRPETTPGSYLFAESMLEQGGMPPLCVWQAGKSYRREQDQPSKHCRFKEFYQQEFQCIYSDTTKNDYQANVTPQVAKMIQEAIGLPTRVVDSDRLPDYSVRTLDVEIDNGDKWMEVCSISLRKDFTYEIHRGQKPMKCLVLEVAIGLDRCVYNINERIRNVIHP